MTLKLEHLLLLLAFSYNSKMKHFIQFGDISWLMLLPFILSIGLGSNSYCISQLFKLNLIHQLFLFTFINSLSKISMIIFNIISSIRGKEKTKTKSVLPIIDGTILITRNSNQSDFHELKNGFMTKTILFLFLLLCSILHYCYYLMYLVMLFINNYNQVEQNTTRASKYYRIFIIFLELLFLTPLNRIVFKNPFYRHHQLALTLSFIGTILYLLSMFEEGIKDYYLFVFIIITGFECCEMVIEKYLMEAKYINIYEILFYEGCIEFVLNLIVFISTYLMFQKSGVIRIFEIEIQNLHELKHVFLKNTAKFLILVLIQLLVNIVVELLIIMTLYYLNPNFIFVSESLSLVFLWILEIVLVGVDSFFSYYSLLNKVGFLLLFLATLIYNEIIIIYICGLENNTKKEIRKRAGNNEINELINSNRQNLLSDISCISDL